jgi:hypothetical protein
MPRLPFPQQFKYLDNTINIGRLSRLVFPSFLVT